MQNFELYYIDLVNCALIFNEIRLLQASDYSLVRESVNDLKLLVQLCKEIFIGFENNYIDLFLNNYIHKKKRDRYNQ